MGGFVNSRSRLARALSANQPGSSTPHTMVVVPSYSVGDSLLAHYGHRIPALEHRFLTSLLMLPRVAASHILFVTSLHPGPEGGIDDVRGTLHVDTFQNARFDASALDGCGADSCGLA